MVTSIIVAAELRYGAAKKGRRATLVTANEREFAKVDDLYCENWLT